MRLKAFTLCMVTTLCLGYCWAAQQVLKTASRSSPSWLEIKPFLDHLSSLPIEYRADLGLSILRQGRSIIPSADAMSFMERLFTSANEAVHPTAVLYAARERGTSSEAMEADNLRRNAADALSIQSAVVEQMLKDAPAAAAQHFAEIQVVPRRATCVDSSVQDLNSYYAALKFLLANPNVVVFHNQPRGPFLLDRFRDAVTPEQIVPLLTVLSSIDPGPEDGQMALHLAAVNLERMTASGRELDAFEGPLSRAMQGLESYAARRKVSLTELASAYRSFLARSAITSSCDGDPESRKYIPVNFSIVRSHLSQETQGVVPLLTLEDVMYAGVPVPANDPSISTFPGFPESLQKRLTHSRSDFSVQAPERTTEEDAAAALAALAQGKASESCELCLFQAHIQVFEALTWRQTSSEPLRNLLSAEVNYLGSNPIEQRDPAAYLSALKPLIDISRPAPESSRSNSEVLPVDRSQGHSLPERTAEHDVLYEQLLVSSDPIIAAYMRFETLFHVVYTPTGYVTAAMS